MSDSRSELPERVALSDAELRIEHKGCQPHGIRDKRGFLLFFPAIVKYYDQEARYEEEIEQQNMLANFLLKSLAAQAAQPVIAEVTATKIFPGFIQLTYSNGRIVKKLPLVDENGDEYMELQPNNPDTFHATTPKDYFLFVQPVIAEAARDDEAERQLDIGKAIERAAAELPDGVDLHIEIERGAGLARLYMPPQGDDDAGDARHDWTGDTFADQINEAIDAAIAARKAAQ